MKYLKLGLLLLMASPIAQADGLGQQLTGLVFHGLDSNNNTVFTFDFGAIMSDPRYSPPSKPFLNFINEPTKNYRIQMYFDKTSGMYYIKISEPLENNRANIIYYPAVIPLINLVAFTKGQITATIDRFQHTSKIFAAGDKSSTFFINITNGQITIESYQDTYSVQETFTIYP